MPQIGAPLTYVTTATFLSVFELGSLRELPDIEALEDAGLLERGEPVDLRPDSLDGVFGVPPDDYTDLETDEIVSGDEAP